MPCTHHAPCTMHILLVVNTKHDFTHVANTFWMAHSISGSAGLRGAVVC